MKLSAKPISSPGRTDKFPPPLMRFLRTNAGSRSRRSRSSPMFVRKKNTTAIETQTQEPSSPKVTCMGQVRVKRPSKQPNTPPATTYRCWWIPKPSPCRCKPLWPFFRRKPTKLQHDSDSDSNSNFHNQESVFQEKVNVDKNNNNNINNNNNNNNNSDGFASISNPCTPPRNALLLTRCRSAPYRSSSLASRFWSSPARDEETVLPNTESTSEEPQTALGERIATLAEPEKVEELSNGREVETDFASRPTVLTRCKSEPARTGDRLDPLVNNLWKKRRLEFD